MAEPFHEECVGHTRIKTRPDADPQYLGFLHVWEQTVGGHEAARGCIYFRTLDEVKGAIRALQKMLPVVDQLGALADARIP